MDFLYETLVAPAVPLLPALLLAGAGGIMWWFVRIFIRPS
jgi:hypothetical protein